MCPDRDAFPENDVDPSTLPVFDILAGVRNTSRL